VRGNLRDVVANAFAVADRAFAAEPFTGPPPADVSPVRAAEIDGGGLRERKAARLRSQLVTSAVRLFRERGYERVTVEDIVRAVDVSPRTFFRYFASKEHVLLDGPFERYARLREMVAARPPDEGPVSAVRNALRALVAACDGPESPLDFDFIQLVCSDPALGITNARIHDYCAQRLTLGLADRTGAPENALEPNVIAAVVQWTVADAIDRWFAGRGRRRVVEMIDEALHALDLAFSDPGPHPG
jgi:AcrR family transcriptional regulator